MSDEIPERIAARRPEIVLANAKKMAAIEDGLPKEAETAYALGILTANYRWLFDEYVSLSKLYRGLREKHRESVREESSNDEDHVIREGDPEAILREKE